MSSGTEWNAAVDDGVADLHTHTTASDGTIGVDRRITLAVECGLNAIAITDHDVVADVLSTPTTHQNGIEVITGVEVRADLFDRKIEILGYLVDPEHPELLSMLDQVREFRHQRNEQLVANVSDLTGLDLSYETLRASLDGPFGRPHLADRLIEADVVDSVQAAFDEYLADDGEAFVPMERLPVEEVVSTVGSAGGVTALAHPGRIRTDGDNIERIIEALAEIGVDGIEAWYPYADERDPAYAPVDVPDALQFADRYDLVPTGGSDCHGPGSGKFRQGAVRAPGESVDRIRDIHRSRT